jgi:hypothetical protein
MTGHQRLTPKSKGLKNHLLGHFLDTFSVLLLWQKFSGFISDPCSRGLAALRADSQLKKGRSPPRPLRPLARGADSALRLVTCWSPDALRLPS